MARCEPGCACNCHNISCGCHESARIAEAFASVATSKESK